MNEACYLLLTEVNFDKIDEMRLYELVFVVKSTLAEEKRKKVIEAVKALFKNVKITKEQEWGQKVLAYPIKHELSGFYVGLSVESENAIEKDLEKHLYQNENILRHLVIRTK